MLRITLATHAGATTLRLEGRLAGAWADELGGCWKRLLTERSADSIRIELDGVTFIDAAGKALLGTMHEQGAGLSAAGCMTRAIVDEITGRADRDDGIA